MSPSSVNSFIFNLKCGAISLAGSDTFNNHPKFIGKLERLESRYLNKLYVVMSSPRDGFFYAVFNCLKT